MMSHTGFSTPHASQIVPKTRVLFDICRLPWSEHARAERDAFTRAVSGFSATMKTKLRLTRSVPLQMQMMQPSKSASVFPRDSNDDKILGS
ncbi:hypothetical protein EYF80_018318 [Liparis tanakae]|uniref:Uncharacterized protein n=1 Tax=Liparis tanakae TaxID=230148 RepID=A0A4Z2I2E8_9TELE|nr:hypothetical protein EYF80_018318 [Liparis tanakae]